jgi:hypothetical protein
MKPPKRLRINRWYGWPLTFELIEKAIEKQVQQDNVADIEQAIWDDYPPSLQRQCINAFSSAPKEEKP